MAEFGFSAKVGADVSGFQKGMQKAEKSLKKFADGITNIGKKGIVGSLANVSLAMGGVVTAFRTATKVVKEVAKAVGECTEAYKQQAIVERTLQTAIQNNPYVSGNALQNLKQFASDMQRISNVGDEQIMQLETQLISLGRTEEETMNIIRVAMDMSASGTMSLDTAITQLNATLNGNIGRLGQQNAELKNLTEEELKSGKAVEILGEKFKGLSEATIDTSKQLKNIKGDFKEAIGEFTLPTSDMWNKFWMGFYEKGIDVVHKLQASLDSSRGEGIYEKLAGSVKKIKNEEEQRRAISDALTMSTEVELNQLQTYLEGLKKRNALQEKTLEQVRATLQYRKDAEEAYQKGLALEEQDEARRQAELDAQKEAEDKIVKLKEEYLKKVAEQEAKWQNIKTITGEEVKAQEKIKFYQDSLVDLMTQAGGQITTNNQLYKDQIAIIQQLQSELKPAEEETSDEWAEKLRKQAVERLKQEQELRMKELEQYEATEHTKYIIKKEYNDKIYALELQGLEREKQIALKAIKGTSNEEEQKRQIIDYYMNEQSSLMSEYNTQYVQDMGQTGTEMGQIFSQMFGSEIGSAMDNELGVMLMVMQKVGEEMKKVFAKVGEFIKNVFQKAVSFAKKLFSGFKNNLTKLFDFNPDTALDNLLKFEDKVLTFFIETLPKLPSFFESALQSISVMLSTIKLNIDKSKVKKLITDLIKTIKKYLPDIVKTGLEIAKEIIEGIGQGIKENKDAIGDILDMLVNTVVEYLPDIVMGIIDALSQLISSIDSRTLVKMIDGIIDLTTKIAIAVIDNAVAIAEKLIPALFEVMTALFKKFPEILKTVLWEAIKGLGKIAETIWNAIAPKLGFENGTNNAPSGLALVGEAGPELVDFKGGERVLNNRNTQKAIASMGNGGGNVFNVTFENTVDTTAFAMMKQLKQYQRNLAFNGVL